MRRPRTTRQWLAQLAVVLALVAMGGCGSTAGPSVLPTDDYIPNFTFLWAEVDAGGAAVNPPHTFNLFAEQTGVSQGALSNTSNENIGADPPIPLTGSYKGHAVTLVIARPSGTVTITGTFTADDTIKLVDGARTYNIKKQ